MSITEPELVKSEELGHAQLEYCRRMGFPMFASIKGSCWYCGVSLGRHYTLEQAGSQHITSCPSCHHSYCD